MNRKTFILAICVLHGLTALLLCLSPAPLGVTSVWALAKVFGDSRFVLAAIYAAATALAVFRESKAASLSGRSVIWYLPQLFIVTVAAFGALVCIAHGAYADGVPRPVAFILRDQAIYPILAFLYFRAISRS